MTIRKQIIWLITLIICIPVFCVIFIPGYRYFTSSNRILLNGLTEVNSFGTNFLSEKDQLIIHDKIRELPSDVQSAILTEDFHIIDTNIPFLTEETLNQNEKLLWDFIRDSSDNYFYQFTKLKTDDSILLLISRIPREVQEKTKKTSFVFTILRWLFILITLALIVIVKLSKNIFNSIEMLEETTEAIASGNISQEIKTESGKGINEITNITTSLEKMRQSLLENQNRRNRFIMGISHDLRTPVAVIKGYTEAMNDGMMSDPVENKIALSIISQKTNQLEGMIDTLLNFIKLESNSWRENLIEQNIVPLVMEFAKDLEITGNVFKRNVKTYIELPEYVLVKYDKQLVIRVFENLMNNALRYSKDNDKLILKSYFDNNNLIISLEDTGIGIAENDLEHIFDLFYRGTNSRREEGMGIGLSVVKSIIDTHAWKIDVESQKDKGTIFTISIPNYDIVKNGGKKESLQTSESEHLKKNDTVNEKNNNIYSGRNLKDNGTDIQNTSTNSPDDDIEDLENYEDLEEL